MQNHTVSVLMTGVFYGLLYNIVPVDNKTVPCTQKPVKKVDLC